MERNKYVMAARNGNIATVRRLLEQGVNVNARSDHKTALSLAALGGHHNIVKLLINKGANIHTKDERNMTPLTWASVRGNMNTIRHLLNAGANINAKSQGGHTALVYSIIQGRPHVTRLLLERGANIPTNLNTLVQKSYMSPNALKVKQLVNNEQKKRLAAKMKMARNRASPRNLLTMVMHPNMTRHRARQYGLKNSLAYLEALGLNAHVNRKRTRNY